MRDCGTGLGTDNAISHRGGEPRTSYARFSDYYDGEIFVDPTRDRPLPGLQMGG